MDFRMFFSIILGPFLEPLNLCFLTTVPCVSSVLPCRMVSFFLFFLCFFCFDFCVDFWMYFGCIFDSSWTPFGHQMSPKNNPKSIRKLTSKKGGSREVRGLPSSAELGSRRANYQRGLVIKKVQLFSDSVI